MFTEFSWSEAIGSSPIFLLIVGCSIVGLGVVIERILFYRKQNGDPDLTLERVLDSLRIGDVNGANRACETCYHPLGAVASLIFDGK